MLFLLDEPDYAHVVEDFEAIHDPSPYSTVHHEEGHSLQVTFQRDFFSFVDKVSVPISDNIKRNNMLAFANRPELMKQYTTSSKYAAVHGDISGIPNYKIMIHNEWKLWDSYPP